MTQNPSERLLDCCRLISLQPDRGLILPEDITCISGTSPRETLENIITAARSQGVRTAVYRLSPDRASKLVPYLPVVAEMQNHDYWILDSIRDGTDAGTPMARVIIPRPGSEPEPLDMPLQKFSSQWSGGALGFSRVNTALACFSILAREHRVEVTQERLIHEYGLSQEEIPRQTLIKMGRDHKLKGKCLTLDFRRLAGLKKAYPAMIRLNTGRYILVAGPVPEKEGGPPRVLACYDPLAGTTGAHVRLTKEELEQQWEGTTFVFKRIYKLTDESQPFGLRWFIPEILKQKRAFFDIALAVIFINLVSLITPIFFQIVIDKVLVNQAFTTLNVLGIGMTGVLVINAALDFLRDYLLLHATNKIDLRITARTFAHMLSLPLDFFERVTAGVLTKHMQQTANIRGFLTGSVFMTMLEATSLFVFLPFLFFYSVKLTGLVLVFTFLICAVMLGLISPFKRRLNALYEAEGGRQAMLVETINGMQTVKAMAIEPKLRGQWEKKVARAVSMQFRVGKISITAKSATQLLQRLMTVILIWTGASLVFDASITVGALIAFQMLAGRVTSPLVRLVGLIHKYQEAALSVEKLGVVMNARQEWGAGRHGARPSLKGDIVLDRVSFRYAPDLPDALKEISLVIPAGSSLGIVGPSGSGKTTLTRMLQKAYFPTTGTIRISDCYLNEIDTAHLRQNTGVVLQESFLFRASVADNIRAGQSSADRRKIIEAALLAGADEFIVKLPQGYDTLLEEGAGNLSGGQRQRLAIARALLTRPDILMLDEATSSLDPESEGIVRKNLMKMGQGRTVIMVSHRLSMLTEMDNIVVLQDGYVKGMGPHKKLLQSCPLYQTLWQQQMDV
jgi:ATP-binding cassette subfamily B protein